MKISNEADKKTEYSQYLSRMLDELCISQSALAKAVGRSQKSVSHYVLGESLPDEKTGEAIETFLREKSVYCDFCHMPSEEFAQLLGELFQEFKGKITQRELAGKIGKYQKDISRYLYLEVKPDTKTQHDILRVFYGLCKITPARFASRHIGTGLYLQSLLEKYTFEPSFPENPLKAGEPGELGGFLQCCGALPYEMQKLIAENFDAFHDNYCDKAKGIAFSFPELAAAMNFFRRLSRPEQEIMRNILEKDAFVGFRNGREKIFFRQITAYREVILADPASLRRLPPGKNGGNEREEILACLERSVSLCYAGNKKMTEELNYKLSFTQDEWYLWMLFLTYCYKGKNLFALMREIAAR